MAESSKAAEPPNVPPASHGMATEDTFIHQSFRDVRYEGEGKHAVVYSGVKREGCGVLKEVPPRERVAIKKYKDTIRSSNGTDRYFSYPQLKEYSEREFACHVRAGGHPNVVKAYARYSAYESGRAFEKSV
ncbi:unnamed protein product [Vitrella brassicaformis CCMP3155]|uniref:Protein kinase domain-containing protein n=1 Tax=Vitrella brassicaformis (strain CCMP3155) TaxID=1169540 RepID=A0A0G4GVD4_VITBC|nr:unnamed protein product [Vitrella brassicaformis CCMP3155]|eukprot:CEM34704.1 unnamed protein product [Vitrella brassicaformis CCMP3155]